RRQHGQDLSSRRSTQPGYTTTGDMTEPSTYRTRTTKDTGRLLQLGAEEALFGCDRLLIDPGSGTRAMHRTLIPFTTAEAIPPLAEEPSTRPAAIYGLLTEDGHKLSWTETVRARMPLPDERTTLRLPDATPVMHLARVTHGADGRPLILEELRTGADRAEFAYRITADKQPTRRTRA
ncbi:UTRA domain-containing protein, partial [Streptomyces turgidiscabies]|uniref:UTRA domain-containing protein n=1 Tax=Streptomyces turgidiscabies TaxID=85558 RepID=UPI0038F5F48E